jgi:hypothetical protein
MRSRLRENGLLVAAAALCTCIVGWISLTAGGWGDYNVEARPAVDALIAGHLGRFLELAPSYGGSLVLRSPFVLLAGGLGAGHAWIYRASALPCLMAAAILGVSLVARMRTLDRSRIACGIALLLCIANPISVAALKEGHPEELLGAVLCIGSVLAAMRGRAIWAGVLLGLAVVNKEWALLAAGPVLIALPERRVRALAAAALTAAVVLAPFFLAGAGGGLVAHVKAAGTQTGNVFQRWQVWWFFGSQSHAPSGANVIAYRAAPGWIAGTAHELIVAVMVPLTLLCAWVRRRDRGQAAGNPLLLLALLLLLRCVLDPWDLYYYALPFVLTLLVWEVLAHARPPVLTLTALLGAWLTFEKTASPGLHLSADTQSLIFLAVAIPAIVSIATALYAPGISARLAIRVRRRAPVPSPA